MVNKTIRPLMFETYLAMIENSIGSHMFRVGYAEVDGEKEDIMKGGELSCAFYVSSILSIFNLIDGIHATVKSTVREMKKAGWVETDKISPGCVVVWEEKEQLKWGLHIHIGFYIGDDKAVSNNPTGTTPYQHHYTFGTKDGGGPERKIDTIYCLPEFMARND